MAKPPVRKKELPPAVFDPGEVTATYPIGTLTKNIHKLQVGASDDALADMLKTMDKNKLQTAETAPSAKKRKATPREPHRAAHDTPGGMSPAVLLALALAGGGGLAVAVVVFIVAILAAVG